MEFAGVEIKTEGYPKVMMVRDNEYGEWETVLVLCKKLNRDFNYIALDNEMSIDEFRHAKELDVFEERKVRTIENGLEKGDRIRCGHGTDTTVQEVLGCLVFVQDDNDTAIAINNIKDIIENGYKIIPIEKLKFTVQELIDGKAKGLNQNEIEIISSDE